MSKPLAIDLYAGLGGWSEGLLAEGFFVVGFDIERHQYGEHRYPAHLVIQDVLTLHGAQFKDAALIVASPPCQEFSYMAMPWKLAKAKAAAIRADTSGKMLADLTRLFDACFRIQAQASLAAGRHIPMVVENVRGAIPWVGRSRWNFGSYHLWGDVPALMPAISSRATLKEQPYQRRHGTGSWFAIDMASSRAGVKDPKDVVRQEGFKVPGVNFSNPKSPGFNVVATQRYREGTKNGGDWFGSGENCSAQRRHSPRSDSRKAVSAMIAKIPFPLARHIAATYYPREGRHA